MLKRKLFLSVVLIMTLCAFACASMQFQTNAYKTLAASATIYEKGYPAFLELHQKGIVTDAQKAKGKELAVKYWAAYHSAQTALETYTEISTAENWDKVEVAINNMSECLEAFTTYIQPFLVKGK